MKLPVSFFTLTRTTDQLLSVHFLNSFTTRMFCIKKIQVKTFLKNPTFEHFRTRTKHKSTLLNYIVTSLFLQKSLAGEYDVTKWTHWFTMLLMKHSLHCLLHMVNFTLYTITCSSMYDVTVAFLKNSFSRGFLFDEDYYKRKLFRPKKKPHTHHYHARYNSHTRTVAMTWFVRTAHPILVKELEAAMMQLQMMVI